MKIEMKWITGLWSPRSHVPQVLGRCWWPHWPIMEKLQHFCQEIWMKGFRSIYPQGLKLVNYSVTQSYWIVKSGDTFAMIQFRSADLPLRSIVGRGEESRALQWSTPLPFTFYVWPWTNSFLSLSFGLVSKWNIKIILSGRGWLGSPFPLLWVTAPGFPSGEQPLPHS